MISELDLFYRKSSRGRSRFDLKTTEMDVSKRESGG